MPSHHIRPLAICVFSRRGRILVNEVHDPAQGPSFFRPLGGGIEFSETSDQTIVREIREELNAEVKNLRLIGTLENIFTYLGIPHHEIVQVYDAEFVDRSIYEFASVTGTESSGKPFRATWRDLDSFAPESALVPEGLLQLLRLNGAHRVRGLLKSPHAEPLTVEQMDEGISRHLRDKHAPKSRG